MSRKFSRNTGGAVPIVIEIVDRAYVVETSTSYKVPARSICTSHDPRRPERNGVYFVGSVGIPNDELTILRSRYEMSSVGRPVHSINLSEMSLERFPCLQHLVLWERLLRLLCDSPHCDATVKN